MVKEKDYKRVVQRECKKKFGFAPLSHEIDIIDTASSYGVAIAVGCRIGTVGYSWSIGGYIELSARYDAKEGHANG